MESLKTKVPEEGSGKLVLHWGPNTYLDNGIVYISRSQAWLDGNFTILHADPITSSIHTYYGSNESLSDDPWSMNTAEETTKAEGQRPFGSRTKGLGIMM